VCGRFFLSIPGADLARQFELATPPEDQARFNIAPGQPVPLVRAERDSAGLVHRLLTRPRWGFVPAWAKDPRTARRPINARAETAANSPLFRSALARRRGLVPASGFYEWQHVGRSARPFAIRPRDGSLLALAAIFETRTPDEDGLETCAILTTQALGPVRSIHARMPLCLPPAAYARWLDPSLHEAAELEPLLGLASVVPLEVEPVDPRVNDVREDDPRLLEPARDLFSAGGAP
jgi:putative SOS response-associated peptidase YedK